MSIFANARKERDNLIQRRAGFLQAAENFKTAGDTAGYKAEMDKAKALNTQIDELNEQVQEADRYAQIHAPKFGSDRKDLTEMGKARLDRLVVSSGGHALLVADSSNNGETVFCCQASAIVNCRRFFCPFYELIKRRKTVCFPNSSCRFATSTINCFLHFLPLVLFQRFTTPCVCFFLVNYRANGRIPLQGNSHG